MNPGFPQVAEDGKRYSLADYLATYRARAGRAFLTARPFATLDAPRANCP
jgi:hypothetical protein